MENKLIKRTKLIIPEATVVRVVEKSQSPLGVGIQFNVSGKNHTLLDEYIDNRTLEETVKKGPGK